MKRLAATALAAAFVAVLAPIASAAPPPTLDGSDYVVLPGQTIMFSNITLNSCHSDQAGVNIQSGDVQVIAFGNNTGFECTAISLETVSFTNATEVTQTYRLWLQDNSCSIIYFADGNPPRCRAGLPR